MIMYIIYDNVLYPVIICYIFCYTNRLYNILNILYLGSRYADRIFAVESSLVTFQGGEGAQTSLWEGMVLFPTAFFALTAPPTTPWAPKLRNLVGSSTHLSQEVSPKAAV